MVKRAWMGAFQSRDCASQAGIDRQFGRARSKGTVATLLDTDRVVGREAAESWAGAVST
jgi:hypothetical protein